jgi:serine/threonine protein kinase
VRPVDDAPDKEGSGDGTKGAADSPVSSDDFLRAAAHVTDPPPSLVQAILSASHALKLDSGVVLAERYRLEREIGRGGMGVVWEATDLATGPRIALKFVSRFHPQRAELQRRLIREARVATAIRHPNVVEVFDVFELEDDAPVLVMELLSGETLRAALLREKRLSVAETGRVLLQVLHAVATAHASGIVHRDLKPENIFLVQHEPGAGAHVKVLDFGVAKLIEHGRALFESTVITRAGSMIGTPCYMAPEQALGEEVDGRADLWAVGVVAYECLSGSRPIIAANLAQVVTKLLTGRIGPLEEAQPGVSPEVSAVVMRMLTPDRAARTISIPEAIEAFARMAAGS